MPGGVAPLNWTPPTPPPPLSVFGNPASYTAAATTQASDYDRIMQSYADLGNAYKNNPLTPTNIAPQVTQPTTAPYTQSPAVTGSIANLSNLAATGGYSGQDIADIRARDISPIRSIYANAQQNVERQRALSGGYSPNFNAVQAQMARDEAQQIADTTTNVNANLAQAIAANKLAASTPYASSALSANAEATAAAQANANIVNQINEANANRNLAAQGANQQMGFQAGLANRQGQTGALQGAASLYGTTPALTSTFGNQVMQATQAQQNQQQLNQNRQNQIMNYANRYATTL